MLAVRVTVSLIRSKSVGGGWDDEFMTGDDQDGDQNGDHARQIHDPGRRWRMRAREAAAAAARLAEAAVRYADLRIAEDTTDAPASDCAGPKRPKPGEFVSDELSLLLRDQPYQIRCLLARTRRLATGLPTVWEAFRRGDVDAEQIRIIDRVARRVTEAATLAAIDDQVIDAAHTRTPKQLQVWLLRLVVRLEPLAFEQRHRRALAERRVTVCKAPTASAMSPAKYRLQTPPPSTACSPPRPAASAPMIHAPTNNAAPTYSPTCSSAGSPTTDTDHHDERRRH